MNKIDKKRHDLEIISNWVKPNSKVLDLGCGDGSLIAHLAETRDIAGYGLELNPDRIQKCLEKGVNVIHTDLNEGLTRFDSNSFDYVILSLTLQAMDNPAQILKEMMRVGRYGIVSFPNFGYWRNRWQIAVKGYMPVSKELPYTWYETPNIHLCTINDFTKLCKEHGFNIDRFRALNGDQELGSLTKRMPNLFSQIAMYQVSKV
jgi:methionine biosynthesis protein MetW